MWLCAVFPEAKVELRVPTHLEIHKSKVHKTELCLLKWLYAVFVFDFKFFSFLWIYNPTTFCERGAWSSKWESSPLVCIEASSLGQNVWLYYKRGETHIASPFKLEEAFPCTPNLFSEITTDLQAQNVSRCDNLQLLILLLYFRGNVQWICESFFPSPWSHLAWKTDKSASGVISVNARAWQHERSRRANRPLSSPPKETGFVCF